MKPFIVRIGLFVLLQLSFACSSSDNYIDTTSPTSPHSLVVSKISQNTANLSWQASTDNIAVSGYSIYRDGVVIVDVQSNSYAANELNSDTSYEFKVKAKDVAGNESGFSNVVMVKTLGELNTLHKASGDIEFYINSIIDNAPSSSGDDYMAPSVSQMNTWDMAVSYILQEQINMAVMKVGEIGYQLTEFADTSNQIFYILEKKNSASNYWGTYVFSKTPERENLILMAPHSKYDTNTGKEAIYCFKETLAKALFLNGTHRCNSSDFSLCSGTTSACGSNEAFRISDVAHNTSSIFQKTTENMFSNISNSVFVQLHGFARQSEDPYVIISNGTRKTPDEDYASLIKNALSDEDNTLTFKIAHVNTSWTRLIGFNNTQGRLINNSNNYCSQSAITTSGRFIHIEQEKTKLRDNIVGWTKMSNALKNVF